MKIKQKAIDHYNRMIAWAIQQPEKGCPSIEDMEDAIDEYWGEDDCPYCNYYSDGNECVKGRSLCKLYSEVDDGWCCGMLWKKMSTSKTWGTWVKRAEKVRQYIIDHG